MCDNNEPVMQIGRILYRFSNQFSKIVHRVFVRIQSDDGRPQFVVDQAQVLIARAIERFFVKRDASSFYQFLKSISMQQGDSKTEILEFLAPLFYLIGNIDFKGQGRFGKGLVDSKEEMRRRKRPRRF